MFKFWWTKDRSKVITKVRVAFVLDAENVEHIVARSYGEIASKKALKEAISMFLRDNGWNFATDNISYDQDKVDRSYEKARTVVQRFMPELYTKDKKAA